ncbi:hypothetical protein Tco_1173520 [Tanacetum coccineum]
MCGYLNRFFNRVGQCIRVQHDVPSADQATTSPAKGEKNTKDVGTNLKDELIDLLGKDVMTQYYTKKLLFDKYCDKIIKRKNTLRSQSVKFLNKERHYTLNLFREDGPDDVISNIQSRDLHFGHPSALVVEVPSASDIHVHRRLGSIFTSVYAAVQKLKKDSWLEL